MNLKRLYYILFLILIFSIQSCDENIENTQTISSNAINDSIAFWVKASKDKSYNIDVRKRFLTKAYLTIKSSQIDSLKLRNLSSIAYQNFKLGDTALFKKQNNEVLAFALKIKDTFSLGDAQWNYASYYNKKQIYDSAYYHFNIAHTYFDRGDYIFESAKTQYGMAFIKGRFRDYSGSEVLTFKAIEKFKKIENYKSLYSCYNHLGQLQKDINEYDRALFYYNKALEYLNKIKKSKSLSEVSLNNIANIYVKQKEYNKALNYYNKVLSNDSLKSQNIDRFARALDNKAHCKFLKKDTVNIVNDLKEALHIRNRINDKGGIVISKIHLAHFFAYKQDTSKAISYAKEANSLAKEIENSRDYLESLSLLSKIDHKHSSEYLEKHIQFSDSIQIVERKIQNKFTRIAYETDEHIEENKRLSQQRIWILVTSFGLISILGLVYFLKIQKTKNEKLLLENEQQKANEQVYLITLKQQEKLEKEKVKERNRIAEELHDGILGKLFGTRVGLGFLDIEGDQNIKEQHQSFLDELQTIEKEIREVSHRLSNNFDKTQISFITIIHQLMENKCKIGNFKCELDFDEHISWQNINEKIKVNLYRIIQEALQNIIKHASAKNVNITFLVDGKDLALIIKDDGIGFNIRQKKKGIGIKNITSRAEKLNGFFNVYSKYNEGTTIKIQIPI
nr:ATP-binding protein [uncultured Psychroserpens sp.]